MSLPNFILANFKYSTRQEIIRCLDKATVIHYDGVNLIVGDDKTIFYFCSTKPTTKQFKKFYETHLPYMKGKILYKAPNTTYDRRIKKNPKGKGYIWLG